MELTKKEESKIKNSRVSEVTEINADYTSTERLDMETDLKKTRLSVVEVHRF